MAMTLETEREAFEKWYVENAFDYEANPLGSRDCGLQWKSWQAARTTQPAPLITDEAVERLAQHIYEQEARNRCKTIDEAVFHRSKWRRAIPEARAMLESTFPAHITQPAQAVDALELLAAEYARAGSYAIAAGLRANRVGNNAFEYEVAIRALTRALAGEQAGWRDIATAPMDGRQMILLLTPSRFPQVAFSNTWWMSGFSVECKPTHWMPLEPLPASPTPDKETQR